MPQGKRKAPRRATRPAAQKTSSYRMEFSEVSFVIEVPLRLKGGQRRVLKGYLARGEKTYECTKIWTDGVLVHMEVVGTEPVCTPLSNVKCATPQLTQPKAREPKEDPADEPQAAVDGGPRDEHEAA